MAPRADAHDNLQSDLMGQLDKATQIARPGPVPLAFDFLMVNPKDIAGDDIDAARLHFEQFVSPFALRVARIMKLAHYRCPQPAIKPETLAIGGDRRAVRPSGRAESKGFDRGRPGRWDGQREWSGVTDC